MPDTDEIIALERAGWEALSTSAAAAGAFFDEHLATDVLMLLPGGMVIDDRATAVSSMGGDPWDAYSLADERAVPLGSCAVTVAYRASARRGGHDYAALMSSTYVREDGAWRLALHQQTPL